MNLQPGLLATKIGMTQLFDKDGTRIPVTVLSVKGNFVTAHRTQERDGYTAVQIGFGDQKASRMTKADLGRFKQAGVTPKRYAGEFRVAPEALAKFPVGQEIAIDLFEEGAWIDVTGTSKGKGFQGVIKRHNMRGMKASHGVHEYYRHGGSIGCRLTPGRVTPGKKMPGQMGNVKKTVQNLRVARIMADEGMVLVRGPVPGAPNTVVSIRFAHKKAIAAGHAKAK